MGSSVENEDCGYIETWATYNESRCPSTTKFSMVIGLTDE